MTEFKKEMYDYSSDDDLTLKKSTSAKRADESEDFSSLIGKLSKHKKNNPTEIEDLSSIVEGGIFERQTGSDRGYFSGSRKTVQTEVSTNLRISENNKVSNSGKLIMAVSCEDGEKVFLYDLDSKRFLICTNADLIIEIGGRQLSKSKEKFITEHGDSWGYTLYKENQECLDYLDSVFKTKTKNWRSELKTELPKPKKRNSETEYLWEGIYDGESCFLYEYSEKSLAFYTPKTYETIGGRSARKLNCVIGGNSYRVYYIPKSNAQSALDGICTNYTNYKLSEPPKKVHSQNSEYTLVKRNTVTLKRKDERDRIEEVETEIILYEISKLCFGFTSSEQIDFPFEKLKNRKIDNKDVFIFPKSNKESVEKFQKFSGIETIDIPRSEEVEELSRSIPKSNTSEINNLIGFVSGMTKFEGMKTAEIGNKRVIISVNGEGIEEVSDDRLIFEGTFYRNEDKVECRIYEKHRE